MRVRLNKRKLSRSLIGLIVSIPFTLSMLSSTLLPIAGMIYIFREIAPDVGGYDAAFFIWGIICSIFILIGIHSYFLNLTLTWIDRKFYGISRNSR